ncbi:MAG TPA: hypothetical protein DCM62_01070 [Bacteroidales bacterium]|nr:hypothetical protein [Bacteroidales bacterium]
MKKNRIFSALIVILVMILYAPLPLAGQFNISGTIVVANKTSNDVYFINASDGAIRAILPTGIEPHEVEISPDGQYAVVGNYGNREQPGNSLSVFHIGRRRLMRTIDLGEHIRPHGIKWLAGTSKVVVTSGLTQSLVVVNVMNGRIVRVIDALQESPHMVTVSLDGRRLFATSVRTGNLSVYDFSAGMQEAVLPSGQGAEGIDIAPDGREIWVTNRAENTISVFDANTLQKTGSMVSSDFPIRGRFTPDGRMFLVSNARSGFVTVFDAESKKEIASIKLQPPLPPGEDPDRFFAEFTDTSVPIGIVAGDNYRAFVANTRADVVSVICLRRFVILDHFQAGKEPDGIGFSPIVLRGRRGL